jgi:hypothetical protein
VRRRRADRVDGVEDGVAGEMTARVKRRLLAVSDRIFDGSAQFGRRHRHGPE